jgi:hypothetical protein
LNQITYMKQLLWMVILGWNSLAFSQIESLSPLSINPALSGLQELTEKAGPTTFDSTFIYTSDTLSLPFFDEFSRDHFQRYTEDYSAADLTFDEKLRLTTTGNVPLPADAKYAINQTYRKLVNLEQNTITDQELPSEQIKVGNLAVYPVVYTTTTVYPPYTIYDTIDFPNDPDTLWMVTPDLVQDSATKFFLPLHDQHAYWLDDNAYRNDRFAINPWSLGVVTFDGLDRTGHPYGFGTTTTGIADFLTSKPINMAPYSAADSLYFSFIYQPQGFGDEPETSDSLILEFYSPSEDQWYHQWSASGSEVTEFKKVMLPVTGEQFFQSAFQFRFKNYGGLSGALDQFHIDYVQLKIASGWQDSVIEDFAFVYPVGSLLQDYTQVPWDHYKESPTGHMSDAVRVVVRLEKATAANAQDGQIQVFYNGVPEPPVPSFVLQDNILTENSQTQDYLPDTVYDSDHDCSNGYNYDPTKPGNAVTFDVVATASAQFPNNTANDSTFYQQHFRNVYAYDDGTAEAAYGITGAQARLAYRFVPYVADSLIGISMHFLPTIYDLSNKLFLLTVWDDNNGVPGTILYEDDFFSTRQPVYEYGINDFTEYYFVNDQKVAITGTFYVGYRQLDPERLNLGFDCNIDNSQNTVFSVNNGGTWITSSIPGSMMMRPIFSTALDGELSTPEIEAEATVFGVYPNPVSELLHLQVNPVKYTGAALFDIQGKCVAQVSSEQLQLDMSPYTPGVYVLRDLQSGATQKIIKK